MQKIYFEKWIDLKHQLNELLSLSVDESINYKIENVGVRAVGSLIVKGEYNDNQSFNENIDLDVLATFDKIVDQRDFNIKVEDFDYFVKEGNIQIKIEVGIHGVIEGEDRYVRDEQLDHDEALEEIENLIKAADVAKESVEKQVRAVEEEPQDLNESLVAKQDIEIIPEEKAAVSNDADLLSQEPLSYLDKPAEKSEETVIASTNEEADEGLQEKVYQTKSRPIFQDTSDSIGTYYLYIVKENDNYSEVAARYNVDEEIIRNYNQDKDLEAGTVLIIPYVP